MSKNKTQFQKGISLQNFFLNLAQKISAALPCLIGDGHRDLYVQSVAIPATAS
jgi:hypothetical protein